MIGFLLEETVILFSDGGGFDFLIFVCDYDWFFIGGSGYFVFRLGR